MRCNRWFVWAAAVAWLVGGGSVLAQQPSPLNEQLPGAPGGAATETQADVEGQGEAEIRQRTETPETQQQLDRDAIQSDRVQQQQQADREQQADPSAREGQARHDQHRSTFLDRLGMRISSGAEGQLTVSALPLDSVAAEAGLRQGDRIISINGQTFNSRQEINQYLQRFPGNELAIEVDRAGERQTMMIDVTEINVAAQDDRPAEANDQRPALGITLTEDRGALFVRSVAPRSPAAEVGLRPGDHLLSINGQQFRSTNDFIGAVANLQPGQQIELVIGRAGEAFAVLPVLVAWSEIYSDQQLAQSRQPQRRMAMRPEIPWRNGQGLGGAEIVGQLQDELQQLRQEVRELRQEVNRLNSSHSPTQQNPAPTTLPNPDLE